MQRLVAAVAVFGVACGGSGETAEESVPAIVAETAPAVTPAPAPALGMVHEVEMKLTNDGQYVFEPAELTIKAGDTVRWLNVSGFPHNIAFYADQIPAGADGFLTTQFAGDAAKLGPMAGRLMIQPGDTYEITFAGAPTGSYGYFCTPHEALGMKATLTVQE